jgi:hypothetical protein
MSLEEVREILDGNTSAEIEDRLRFTHRGILLRTGWTPETFDDPADYEEEMQRLAVLQRLSGYYRAILVERVQQEAWDEATDLPLTAEQIAKIEGAGYEVCRFEGEGCEECGRSCVRVWWMRGSYEYPEEGSYYCDKCALARAVAEDRRAAFGQKYCSPCPDAGRTCWCSESDLDACIEERRFRCPEDRLLRW